MVHFEFPDRPSDVPADVRRAVENHVASGNDEWLSDPKLLSNNKMAVISVIADLLSEPNCEEDHLAHVLAETGGAEAIPFVIQLVRNPQVTDRAKLNMVAVMREWSEYLPLLAEIVADNKNYSVEIRLEANDSIGEILYREKKLESISAGEEDDINPFGDDHDDSWKDDLFD